MAAPPLSGIWDPGRNETERENGKRQKASATHPASSYQESNSSLGGPTWETFRFLHWPELGHVVTSTIRESEKAIFLTGHTATLKKRTEVL